MEKFAQERPMEADTIRAVEFHACKADQIEVLVPKALEKKLHYLRSPRNLEILESALVEKLGTKLQLVYLVGESSNAEGKSAPARHPPRQPPPRQTGPAATEHVAGSFSELIP